MKTIRKLALAGLLLAGCSQTSTYHIAVGDTPAIRALDGIYLQMEPLENGPLTVEVQPEPWRYQAVSSQAVAAQYSAPPPSPGTSPGQAAAAGAVGGLLGTLIAKGMVKDQAQAAAQQPAMPLVEKLMGRAIQRDVREGLVDGVLTSGFAAQHSLIYGPQTDRGLAVLKLQPSIKLTNRMDVFKFNINAELSRSGEQPLYRNSIEYWSAGTGYGDKLDNLAYWQVADLEAFYQELDSAIAHTSDYLAMSLDGALPEAQSQQATHKVAANGGWVMLRGNVIRAGDGLTVIRDLRGNIKIIRGSLMQ
ncbi:hypothetical protein [Microbulbifer halophilus]|uniref:Lipoprotein n=1 Tax=Microbulbifer halophilus TaxID=453963 RepID=A0ABW5EB21_9GAMM|nr:hypothetical protein [Microbulbifer halophilus]MCW8125434.1 hypothetical protein [Microbulbifer halophilus]